MYRRTNDHLRGDGADLFFHILVGSFFFFCIIGPIFPYTLFGPFFYLARACTVKDDDKNNPCISYINRIDRLLLKSLRDVLRMKTEVMNRVIILSNTCVSTHSKYPLTHAPTFGNPCLSLSFQDVLRLCLDDICSLPPSVKSPTRTESVRNC